MRNRTAAATGAFAAFLIAGASTTPSRAAGFESIVDDIRSWATAPVAVLMIEGQNGRHDGIDQAGILELDRQWRAEAASDDRPLIARIMGNPLSSYLIRVMAESAGLYTEIAVMDANGLNVGQSAVTTDYWQGDEDKFLQTYAKGLDAVHLGEIDTLDDGRRVRQVSMTLADPGTGAAIGAIFVEVDLDELAER
ncbi:MAG: hypothetical protein RID91_19625 [Azospirillaceae bacterium]